MSVVSVNPKSFILALFIRDDDERFLLGDSGYDFKDSQLHFVANTMENDEVAKQGADGVMLAGQVRRASVQPFDGYIGDATDTKEQIEEKRKAFIAFFAKGHHFRVVYVDCNRNAWQRKGGYIVDAPEVKEIWQIHPEYHVGLNFEDVNYYSYNEDAHGNEILSNEQDVPIAKAVSGGLVWDEDGAVSEEATTESDGTTANSSEGTTVNISDSVEAPIVKLDIKGNTVQNGTPTPSAPVAVQTVTGENVVKICGKNLLNLNGFVEGRLDNGVLGYASNTTALSVNGGSISFTTNANYRGITTEYIAVEPGGTYSTNIPTTGVYGAQIAQYDNAMNFISQGDLYLEQTYSNTTHYVRIYLFLRSAGSATLDSLQLEKGTATAYEAYKSQSYEVNFNLEHGKNMLDPSTLVDGYISVNGEYNTAHSNDEMRSGMIAVEPNTAYTFSIQATSSTYDPWFGVGEYTSDNVTSFVRRDANSAAGATSITFTTSATTNYIAVSARNLKTATKVQLEQGSSATTYEPWSPLELCKIGDYQDYIWNDNGTWKKHKAIGKLIFNGTEDWDATSGTYPYYTTFSPAAVGTYCDGLCSHFRNRKAYPNSNGYFAIRANGNSASFYNSSTATLAAWKTWLGSNNLAMYYPLATATDETITNATLITQLDNLASAAYTYQGQTNISDFVVAGNSQAMLKAEYYTSYKVNVISGGYVWEAGGSGGPTTVVNDSISNVSPIWTVHGPVLNPILENTTTNEEIEYVGMIADGQTLVVDMGEQTASLNGLNVVSNIVGDYISLAPGRNILLYSATSGDEDSEIGWSEIVG